MPQVDTGDIQVTAKPLAQEVRKREMDKELTVIELQANDSRTQKKRGDISYTAGGEKQKERVGDGIGGGGGDEESRDGGERGEGSILLSVKAHANRFQDRMSRHPVSRDISPAVHDGKADLYLTSRRLLFHSCTCSKEQWSCSRQ